MGSRDRLMSAPVHVGGPATRAAEGVDGPPASREDVGMNESASESESVDPVIVEAVENISNRFGVQGLCDLIALAREELARAEAALRELSEIE